MERLTIDEVIDHCNRTKERSERVNGLEALEHETMDAYFMKEYWEHRQVAEWLEELKRMKMEEENGLLLRLPCKVGDTVFFIGRKCAYCEEDDCYGCPYSRNGSKSNERFVHETVVQRFYFSGDKLFLCDDDEVSLNSNLIGEEVFLIKEEAEAKLAELRGEKQ